MLVKTPVPIMLATTTDTAVLSPTLCPPIPLNINDKIKKKARPGTNGPLFYRCSKPLFFKKVTNFEKLDQGPKSVALNRMVMAKFSKSKYFAVFTGLERYCRLFFDESQVD